MAVFHYSWLFSIHGTADVHLGNTEQVLVEFSFLARGFVEDETHWRKLSLVQVQVQLRVTQALGVQALD